MSEDDRPKNPLWKYLRNTAFIPSVAARPAAKGGPIPTLISPGPDELEPLRVRGEWRPQEILRILGPADDERQTLSRLIVACCVVEGAARFHELTGRLEYLATRAKPRLEQMMREPLLKPRHDLIEALLKEMGNARRELISVRAHAQNDMTSDRPGGMRIFDLLLLVHHGYCGIAATEIGAMRNLVGVERAVSLTAHPPDLDFAETWLDRVLPSAPPSGIQLFDPPQLGRVVVVHDDGRLAYDPLPVRSEDELADEEVDDGWD